MLPHSIKSLSMCLLLGACFLLAVLASSGGSDVVSPIAVRPAVKSGDGHQLKCFGPGIEVELLGGGGLVDVERHIWSHAWPGIRGGVTVLSTIESDDSHGYEVLDCGLVTDPSITTGLHLTL